MSSIQCKGDKGTDTLWSSRLTGRLKSAKAERQSGAADAGTPGKDSVPSSCTEVAGNKPALHSPPWESEGCIQNPREDILLTA